MKARSPLSGLWWLSGGLAVLFGLLCVLRYGFPPAVEPSATRLYVQPGVVTVEFDVTSRLATPTRATLLVRLGRAYANRWRGAGVDIFDHQEVSVDLAPAQTQQVRCRFTGSYSFSPDFAEAVVVR